MDYRSAVFISEDAPGNVFKNIRVVSTPHFRLENALMLSYKSGDRCIRCGNGAFHVGRNIATCANPRCELPVPLG